MIDTKNSSEIIEALRHKLPDFLAKRRQTAAVKAKMNAELAILHQLRVWLFLRTNYAFAFYTYTTGCEGVNCGEFLDIMRATLAESRQPCSVSHA